MRFSRVLLCNEASDDNDEFSRYMCTFAAFLCKIPVKGDSGNSRVSQFCLLTAVGAIDLGNHAALCLFLFLTGTHVDLGDSIICDRLFLAFYSQSKPTIHTTRSRCNKFS